MPQVSYRDLTPDDEAFLWALQVDTYREYIEQIWGWDEAKQRASFRQKMDRSAANLSREVVEFDGVPAGFLEVESAPDTVVVGNIQIHSAHRGRGLGGTLMKEVMEAARTQGKDVTLQVFRINTRAQAFYARLGFVAGDRNETHLQMRWFHRSTEPS